MSESQDAKIGTLAWRDLTVEDAKAVHGFYKNVVGWESQSVEMDGYSDFNMIAPGSGETVAGICHARGANAKLPAQWLMYIVVADIDASATACAEHGGKLLDGPRALGSGRFCVIQDPAGAVCALYSP
jgi:predicted enzyme related to lactoylglutathione lyase